MTGTASIETGQFAELAAAVVQQLPRDMDPTTAQGWITNRAALQKALREMLMPNEQNATNLYPISVNLDLSLQAMVRAGKYNYANPDITRDHFSVSGEGTKDVTIELVHFDRFMESDDVIRELAKKGLRPATLEELLAFGAKYPEKQREFPIVALGSVWQRTLGVRSVAYLWSSADERSLILDGFKGRWFEDYRFAAVRK